MRLDTPTRKTDLAGMIAQMAVRCVSNTVCPPSRSTIGNNTAAGVSGSSPTPSSLNEMPGPRLGQQTGPQAVQIDRHAAGASSSISAFTDARASCSVSSDRSLIEVATRSADSTLRPAGACCPGWQSARRRTGHPQEGLALAHHQFDFRRNSAIS